MPLHKHGHATRGLSPEYRCWQSIRQRCSDDPNYSHVSVCARWDDFANFLADMGPRPSLQHSIDRYPDRSGNYEPGNCRWATSKEQNRNRKDNRLVMFRGASMPVSAAAELANLPYITVIKRLNAGWSETDALGRAVRPKRASA